MREHEHGAVHQNREVEKLFHQFRPRSLQPSSQSGKSKTKKLKGLNPIKQQVLGTS